jgi:hypothetical protein
VSGGALGENRFFAGDPEYMLRKNEIYAMCTLFFRAL